MKKIKLDTHLCKNIALAAVRKTFSMLSHLADKVTFGLFSRSSSVSLVHAKVASMSKREADITSVRSANELVDTLHHGTDFKNTKGL